MYQKYLLQCRRSYRTLLLNAEAVQTAEKSLALMLRLQVLHKAILLPLVSCSFAVARFCICRLAWHKPRKDFQERVAEILARIHACPFVPSQILCSQDSLSLWTNSSMPRSASFGSSFKVLFDSGHDCFIRIKNRVPRRYMIYGIQGPSQAAKTSFAKQLFQKPFVVTVQNSTTLNLKDFVYGHHDALCFGKAWQVFFV